MTKNHLDPIQTFPDELSLEVLSWLDYKSLCRASTVNREWRRLADDHLLWRKRGTQDFPGLFFPRLATLGTQREKQAYRECHQLISSSFEFLQQDEQDSQQYIYTISGDNRTLERIPCEKNKTIFTPQNPLYQDLIKKPKLHLLYTPCPFQKDFYDNAQPAVNLLNAHPELRAFGCKVTRHFQTDLLCTVLNNHSGIQTALFDLRDLFCRELADFNSLFPSNLRFHPLYWGHISKPDTFSLTL